MGEAHHTVFQEYLLARVQGQDATVRESLSQLDFSGRIKLNEKFAALKAVEKIFQNLPQLESDPRESIIKETAFLNKDKFAGCQIIRKLGQGGMGVVYLAYQEKLQREVVIKILHPFAAESETLRQRFIREGHIIGHLDHENIVPVYDVGDEDGTYYIIMKYIEGVPLNHIIDKLSGMDRGDIRLESITSIVRDTARSISASQDQLRGKSSTEYFCNLMIKVADAVQYAHGKGVVHRDIKPANIIITPSGNPVLVDFGLGHDEIQQSLTLSGEFLGTPIYSAPELLQKGKIENTQLLDVYSLGVTLYELLTGGVPYEGESVYDIFLNIKRREPIKPRTQWKKIPKEAETIILKAITKDIRRRYQTVGGFHDDLYSFLNGRPIKAKSPSYYYRSTKWVKRNKRPVILSACLLLAVTTSVGGYYYNLYRRIIKIKTNVQTLILTGQFDKAEKQLGEATVLFPQRPEGWYYLGSVQTATGNYSEGIKNMEHAITLKADPKYYYTLSTAYLFSGNIPAAAKVLKQALTKYPGDYNLLGQMGFAARLEGDYDSALEFAKTASKIESSGFNDEGEMIMAYALPAKVRMAQSYRMMGYENIAKHSIVKAITLMPANKNLYAILESYPLQKKKRLLLRSLMDKFGSEYLRLEGHNIELKMPSGWARRISPMTFGPDALAVYQNMLGKAINYIVAPTVILFHLENSTDSLAEAYSLLDRTMVKFNGTSLSRRSKPIRNHPFKKYSITTTIKVPLATLKGQAVVVEQAGATYLLAGFAPLEIYKENEDDISTAMNSIGFSKNDDWSSYVSPNNEFTVEMPSTPIFYQAVIKSNDGNAIPVKQDRLASLSYGSASKKYVVMHTKGELPVDIEDQNARISAVEKSLSKIGKIIFKSKTKNVDAHELKMRVSMGDLLFDVKVVFIENHVYFLEVDQNKDLYDESSADRFFKSFKHIGPGINLENAIYNILWDPEVKNAKKGYREYLAAAESGDSDALNEIGKLYLSSGSSPDGKVDYDTAMTFFKEAADNGHGKAISNIGLMYSLGWGVEKNTDEAIVWFRKAAEMGIDIAQYNLGIEYARLSNYKEALKWLEMAAENGNQDAMAALGKLYEDGKPGIEVDLKKADYWYGKYYE